MKDPHVESAVARPWYRRLYMQVLAAIALGVLLGVAEPALATAMKPLGDAFVKLVRMLIAPIIFVTVVSGIAGVRDLGRVGRVGLRALIYFELVSTLALAVGMGIAALVRPGDGFDIDPASLDASVVAGYAATAAERSTVQMLLHLIPDTVVGAFADGDILQVLVLGLLFGIALLGLGPKAAPITRGFDLGAELLFAAAGRVMALAPIGAFGAMAFTIGRYGFDALLPLAQLIGSVYATSALFVFVVLGLIARVAGFSLWRFLVYIREELLIVLGTSSSESALPKLMQKLERLGAATPVVGLVVPTGYSFNLDGTNIYMTMAALFIAQALNIDLTLGQQLSLLAVAMLTSKGATGVTGAGFVTLAATLQVVPTIPVAGMALILGVDRFLSECRALTNFIGNGVATLVVARWEGALDRERLQRELSGGG